MRRIFVFAYLGLTIMATQALKPELECLRPLLGVWRGSYAAGTIFDLKAPLTMRFKETKEGDIKLNMQISVPEFDKEKYFARADDEYGLSVRIYSKESGNFKQLSRYYEEFEASSMDALITKETVHGGISWQNKELVTENWESELQVVSCRKAFFDQKKRAFYVEESDEEDLPMLFVLGEGVLEFKILNNQDSIPESNALAGRSEEASQCNRKTDEMAIDPTRQFLRKHVAQIENQRKYEVDCVLTKIGA